MTLALIPLLPLFAFTVLILIGRRLGKLSPWVTVAALSGSCALTLSIRQPVFESARLAIQWPWLFSNDARWVLGLHVDGLSWVMLFIVTFIGALIALYSMGYMHDDPRYSRFFAYLALFCSAMLGLVMADHLVLLYACWELVGLCSYLLISFWFEKPAAAAAGKKAFITTRIGDTGLMFGILFLISSGVSLHFNQLGEAAASLSTAQRTLISTLIFLGAVGKSAQIPLHVWLPDAMEGPTPVSALIHAATMVAAGVYLLARTLVLFTPDSLNIVLTIGLTTHLLAGTVALTMTDIKRILAYSTLSQLGLMVTAMGLGAASLAMFHLGTHAFFKALLFLGAGSVIHAAHSQELKDLGGLRGAMPWTAALFLVASLAMSGVFPLSGFWSKDAILLAAGERANWLLAALVTGAVMTTTYIFRLYLRCFEGASHASGHHHHPHESPWIMVGPMALLGLGAAFAGLSGSHWFYHPFFHLLGDHHVHEGLDMPILIISTAAAAAGMTLAWFIGFKRQNWMPAALRPVGFAVYTLAYNKYYVDEIYERLIIRPFHAFTRGLAEWDRVVIDGIVNLTGETGRWLGELKERFDRLVIDRVVNGIAQTLGAIGSTLRWVQTGIVQHYLFIVVAAVVVWGFLLRQ